MNAEIQYLFVEGHTAELVIQYSIVEGHTAWLVSCTTIHDRKPALAATTMAPPARVVPSVGELQEVQGQRQMKKSTE